MRQLIAALVVLAAPLGAVAAEVERGAFGDWRYEIVSRTAPGGDKRVACTVANGPVDGPRVLLSLASPENVNRDALFGFSYAEFGPPMGGKAIGHARMVDFFAGETRAPGRIVIAAAPDGEDARSEVYPEKASIEALLIAMGTADELRLEREAHTLRRISLKGFAPAFAMAAKACGYASLVQKS